jgi:hypothetical protein
MSAIWASANWTWQFGIRPTRNQQFGLLPLDYMYTTWQNNQLLIVK